MTRFLITEDRGLMAEKSPEVGLNEPNKTSSQPREKLRGCKLNINRVIEVERG